MRLWRCLVIVVAGAVLGLAWNALGGRGFALSANVYVRPGDEVVAVAEARRLFDRGALFLDARPRDFYEMEHVEGALSLPEHEFPRSFAALGPRLRGTFDVVVYCDGAGCEASHVVSRQLKARGIPAAILDGGWPAWQQAGHPTREGPRP